MSKRTVFITGGASGIGFGIAQAMSKAGHHVIIADINEQAAQRAASDILKEGGSASAIEVDVCNAQQVAALPDLLKGQKVDVLINNAGIQHVSRIEDFPSEKWQQLINIMLVGPALLTQAFLPGMRELNFGRIINIGSIHSLVASLINRLTWQQSMAYWGLLKLSPLKPATVMSLSTPFVRLMLKHRWSKSRLPHRPKKTTLQKRK